MSDTSKSFTADDTRVIGEEEDAKHDWPSEPATDPPRKVDATANRR